MHLLVAQGQGSDIADPKIFPADLVLAHIAGPTMSEALDGAVEHNDPRRGEPSLQSDELGGRVISTNTYRTAFASSLCKLLCAVLTLFISSILEGRRNPETKECHVDDRPNLNPCRHLLTLNGWLVQVSRKLRYPLHASTNLARVQQFRTDSAIPDAFPYLARPSSQTRREISSPAPNFKSRATSCLFGSVGIERFSFCTPKSTSDTIKRSLTPRFRW